MPDIWQQQLTELRERFRQLCDHRNPLFHILVEGSEIAQAPLMLLPDTAVIARHFGSEDPGMCPVDKWVGEIPEDKAFRYSNGEIAGIQRPAIHRIHEFRCAVHREVEFFTRAAKDVIDLIRIFPPTVTSRFPSSIQDLCRTVKPRLTVFDTVRNSSGDSDWMVLMHRLGWIHNPQWRLEARRFCWGDEGHLQIAIDPEIPEKHRPPQITEMLKRVNTNRWFSILGEKAALDVFDASMRTIDVLLGYANETRMGSPGILETPKSVIPIPTQTEHLPSGDWLMPPLSLTEIGKRIGNANKKKIHTLLDQYKLRNYPEGNRQSWSVCLDPPMPRSLRQQLEALPAKK